VESEGFGFGSITVSFDSEKKWNSMMVGIAHLNVVNKQPMWAHKA
jgi:hypothetical protein